MLKSLLNKSLSVAVSSAAVAMFTATPSWAGPGTPITDKCARTVAIACYAHWQEWGYSGLGDCVLGGIEDCNWEPGPVDPGSFHCLSDEDAVVCYYG
jgi:hypothetical protein